MDPLGLSTFETATVFGQERRVFRLDGNRYSPDATFAEQAGLVLDVSQVLPTLAGDTASGGQSASATTNYSVELVFAFTEFNDDQGWRKILDMHNRQSDTGLYLEPGELLQAWDGFDVGELATGATAVPTLLSPQ